MSLDTTLVAIFNKILVTGADDFISLRPFTVTLISCFLTKLQARRAGAEAAIQSTILNLREDMNIAIVAHRLSTVQSCDVLYWLDGSAVRRHDKGQDMLMEYESFLQKHGGV